MTPSIDHESGEKNVNKIYKKDDRPAVPLKYRLFSWALTASFWAYPVSAGGVFNLLHFVLWSFASIAAGLSFVALFIAREPSKHRDPGPLTMWLSRLAFWGGLAWMAYHEIYALTALLMVSSLLIRATRNTADEKAGYA